MGFVSLLLIVFGLFMVIRPSKVWALLESWKSLDASGPSPLYLASARLGGILCILAGIGGALVSWLL